METAGRFLYISYRLNLNKTSKMLSILMMSLIVMVIMCIQLGSCILLMIFTSIDSCLCLIYYLHGIHNINVCGMRHISGEESGMNASMSIKWR